VAVAVAVAPQEAAVRRGGVAQQAEEGAQVEGAKQVAVARWVV